MTLRPRAWARLACFAAAAARAAAAELDLNGDGVVRVALLAPPKPAAGIEAEALRADLESMLKAAKPSVPARVSLEPVSANRTLMGWWYNPDLQAARAGLFAGRADYLLLAESEEAVRGYPEFFFEGVRALSRAAESHGVRPVLVLLAKPGNTFRDMRVQAVAEIAYRVGDGCGVEVVPAAFGWMEALAHNRVTGDSPIKARAGAFLAAAAVYCQLADARVPKAALETDWTTKKTAEQLAVSARDAVAAEGLKRHYAGPFAGVVRVEPRVRKRLAVYGLSTAESDPLRQNLQFILEAASQEVFWKTPADWYREGFDRHSAPFDLAFGDLQQMAQYLDPALYTSSPATDAARKSACVALYCRNPEGDPDGTATLRSLEALLIEGYDFAKSRKLVFLPYQLAWARARLENPHLVRESAPGKGNDWLTYMLASMLYTLATDRFQPVPEREKPHGASDEHPRGFHERCARIGSDTLRQLATLTEARNAVLLRSESCLVDAATPGFVGVRLLDRPRREVRVFCATDLPGAAQLSRESLLFTPENYDIEQTVRLAPATNAPALFCRFMASAQSEDRAVDGACDQRPFVLNLDERQPGALVFERESASPQSGFSVPLRPATRPADLVRVTVEQHGRVTEELYFSPDQEQGTPVRLYPTAEDYRRGTLEVTVRTFSADKRFDGRCCTSTFRITSGGAALPAVRVTAPEEGSVIAGPAFVTARAEAQTGGVPGELGVFLGRKRLGVSSVSACAVAVEQGPPQSRLGPGAYALWSAVTLANGVVVASEPVAFRVSEPGAVMGKHP